MPPMTKSTVSFHGPFKAQLQVDKFANTMVYLG
jgi:hypothetical protein